MAQCSRCGGLLLSDRFDDSRYCILCGSRPLDEAELALSRKMADDAGRRMGRTGRPVRRARSHGFPLD